MNDYVDKPFVYENYIATETAITSNTDTQPPQPQLQESIIIEERSDPGSNVFTVSDVFTATQCDEIVNYIQKNSALWQERDVGYASGNNVECKFFGLKYLGCLSHSPNKSHPKVRCQSKCFDSRNLIYQSFFA